MPDIPDLPKYIRYDFLITLIGIILLSSFWYYSVVIRVSDSSLGFLFIAGLIFTALGLSEMFSNYKDERDLTQLENVLKNKKLFNSLKEEGIISNEEKQILLNSLKEKIKEIVDKSKDHK